MIETRLYMQTNATDELEDCCDFDFISQEEINFRNLSTPEILESIFSQNETQSK